MPAAGRKRQRKGAAQEKEQDHAPSAEELPKTGNSLDQLAASAALGSFLAYANAPEVFLEPGAQLSSQARSITKLLFDYSKRNETKKNLAGPIQSLLVENFDDEQIWQEIKLQNDSILRHVDGALRKLPAVLEDSGADESEGPGSVGADGTEDSADAAGDEIGEEMMEEVPTHSSSSEASKKQRDLFFDVDEMAQFIAQAEKEAAEEESGKKPPAEEEDDEEDEDQEGESYEDVRYADFFDAPNPERLAAIGDLNEEEEAEEEQAMAAASAEEGEEEEEAGSLDSFGDEDQPGSSEGELSDEGQAGDSENEAAADSEEASGSDADAEAGGALSKYEQEQARLAKKIARLEEVNIGDKPWTLLGEVTSTKRPAGSLLEVDLDYEQATKQAPVVTPEVTRSLDELIRNRIKQQLFDDPVRKTEADLPKFKPKVQLDEEKSKKGLGELYEEEFLHQTAGVEKPDQLSKTHQEIAVLFKQLCYKLDALSNFHYTPKPPKEELAIKANVPAIRMEEVTPLAVSTADTLAPQEIYAKGKKEVRGDTELTQADRKKERKHKKEARRSEQRKVDSRQKAAARLNPALKKKESAKELVSKISKNKNTVVAANTANVKDTKSTAFFAKLQEDVQRAVRPGGPAAAAPKHGDSFATQANFLKL